MAVIYPWQKAQSRKQTLRERIIQFWEWRLHTDPIFTFQQLSDFMESGGWRPNSPGRVLELLRKEGRINYVVEKANWKNRRASRYKALPQRRA